MYTSAYGGLRDMDTVPVIEKILSSKVLDEFLWRRYESKDKQNDNILHIKQYNETTSNATSEISSLPFLTTKY